MKNILVILLLVLTLSPFVKVQSTFLRFYEGFQGGVDPYASFQEIVQLTSGNFVCLGVEYDNASAFSSKIVYTMYSNEGQLLRIWRENGLNFPSELSLVATYDGGFVVAYQYNTSVNNSFNSILKFDETGSLVWRKQIDPGPSEVFFHSLLSQSQDSSIIVGGFVVDSSSSPRVLSRYFAKLSISGDSIWHFRSQAFTNILLSDIVSTNDGGCIFIRDSLVVQGIYYLNAVKLNSLGNIEWSKVYQKEILGNESIALLPSGGFAISSTVDSTSYVMLANAQGDSLTLKTFNTWDEFSDIAYAPDGGFIITGTSGINSSAENILLLKLDEQLNEVWRKEVTRIKIVYGASVIVTDDGGYAFCGHDEPRAFIAKTDSLGNKAHTMAEGRIVADLNNNCTVDSTDAFMARQLVQIDATDKYYGYTNNRGFYSIEVYDTGQAHVIWHANGLWDKLACQVDSIPIVLSTNNISVVDIIGQASISCPDLSVSINTPFLRRCFSSAYTVEYCNNGTLPANGAYIDVEMDPYLTVDSASMPWVLPQSGNLYQFQLDTLTIGQCGNFNIWVTVDCDSTVLGQSHCVSAHIYPDSICLPLDPAWDGSSVKVSGKCDLGDTLDFKIENVGTANMTSPSFFLIAEDNVMYNSGNFQLQLGDSLKYRFKGNGSTYTLLAQQVEGHPGYSYPKIAVEGCGTNNNGTHSIGYLNQFPHDDRNNYIDVLCLQNIGSFDPNDKRAEPQGLDNEGYITSDQTLDYTIRFQNTGSDTAFTVVIIDTLSDKLDITTLRLGATSHAYTFQIIGSNILEWTFSNMLLPDSNVNEPLSHGFVSFSIDQREGNSPSTEITNRAGIYFDFNDVVLTNTTLNTIIDDYKTWFVFVESPESTLQLGLYPNPNSGTFNLKFDKRENASYEFVIYDLSGAKQFGQMLDNKPLHELRPELPTGMYIYQLTENGATIGTGKLVVNSFTR